MGEENSAQKVGIETMSIIMISEDCPKWRDEVCLRVPDDEGWSIEIRFTLMSQANV